MLAAVLWAEPDKRPIDRDRHKRKRAPMTRHDLERLADEIERLEARPLQDDSGYVPHKVPLFNRPPKRRKP